MHHRHSFDGRAFHLILLLFVCFRLSSSETTSAAAGEQGSSPSSPDSSSLCDPSSKSCSAHSRETQTRIQQLKDSNPTESPAEPPPTPPSTDEEEENMRNETETLNVSNNTTAGPTSETADEHSSSTFRLQLPSLKLTQRDFFSITDRINALRNLFQSVINLDRDLMILKPIVPSRMSRGSFLIKLFSNLLKIMPFHEVRENNSDEAPASRIRHMMTLF
jgi:hypothetical protein